VIDKQQREAVMTLAGLLSDPHPGVSTWVTACEQQWQRLAMPLLVEETAGYQLGFAKGYESANVDHCEEWMIERIDVYERDNVELREANRVLQMANAQMADRLVDLGVGVRVNMSVKDPCVCGHALDDHTSLGDCVYRLPGKRLCQCRQFTPPARG
jgi:hypothetical protein